ncbi:hypothetical protein [Burkholderia vietnamiensis]|nr:hypothetical protein [Burkholderia vietnamiensis]
MLNLVRATALCLVITFAWTHPAAASVLAMRAGDWLFARIAPNLR